MPDAKPIDAVAEFLKTVKVTGTATVLDKPGAVKLDGYPMLAYAPAQWGVGVRTENNGTPVSDIAIAAAETPDFQVLADRFGVTVEHVAEALRYALAVGFVEA
jgi:uncharacterized protein (DUF433 family)